jgi:2-polyprenyl-6-methoxyphenol hydroxylase-like FAD-dependent oxidoreductase
MRVAIADRSNIDAGVPSPTADDWDARVYAISPGSVAFLSGIGAWQRLPKDRLCAIEAMDVRGDAGGKLVFSAYELGERALAWIVENRELHAALVACVRETLGIDVLAPRAPASIAWSAAAAELSFDDGEPLSSRLIVAADGVRSWARAQAGMHHDPKPYSQTAVVANFASERVHHGRAFQWFLRDEGVLAWLPLPGRRSRWCGRRPSRSRSSCSRRRAARSPSASRRRVHMRWARCRRSPRRRPFRCRC